jgi:hypothetical protein
MITPRTNLDPIVLRAADWWNARCDTKQIAKALGVDEAAIWNRMDQIKAAARARA